MKKMMKIQIFADRKKRFNFFFFLKSNFIFKDLICNQETISFLEKIFKPGNLPLSKFITIIFLPVHITNLPHTSKKKIIIKHMMNLQHKVMIFFVGCVQGFLD